MTPKQKAEALFQGMYWQMFKINYKQNDPEKKLAAKQCAAIAARESLQVLIEHAVLSESFLSATSYWNQVINDIDNL